MMPGAGRSGGVGGWRGLETRRRTDEVLSHSIMESATYAKSEVCGERRVTNTDVAESRNGPPRGELKFAAS